MLRLLELHNPVGTISGLVPPPTLHCCSAPQAARLSVRTGFTEGNQRNLTKHACQFGGVGGHFPCGKRNVSSSAECTSTGAKDTVTLTRLQQAKVVTNLSRYLVDLLKLTLLQKQYKHK